MTAVGRAVNLLTHLDGGFTPSSSSSSKKKLGLASLLTNPSSGCSTTLSWNGAFHGAELPFLSNSRSLEPWSSTGTVKIISGRKNVSTRRFQQSKSRISEAPKKLGRVGGPPDKNSPILSGTDSYTADVRLNEDQAIGQVVTAQANFMRVIVQRAGNLEVSQEFGLGFRDPKAEDSLEGGKEGIVNGENGHVPTSNGLFSKNSPEKELEVLCVVRNVLKKIGRRVLVGDRVLVTGIDWIEKRGMIEDVIDRRSEILDPPVANVNYLLLVFSIDQPQIDEKVLSRFLVEVESTDIPFSLVLNKVDLVQPEVVRSWQERLASWGYDPVLCSADERIGLSNLTTLLKNKISVILGPSGVGKSSLINALRDHEGLSLWNEADEEQLSKRVAARAQVPAEEIFEEAFEELRVGEVSASTGRGRHTTRHVSLLRVPGGSGRLADTPGFSQPSLAKVTSTSLSSLFPEVARRIDESENDRCGFPNCFHVGEPFCAVGQDWERYSHYFALLEEVRNREKVEKRVLGTKRESEVRYKVGTDGVKQAEPRLALKKHRRESRKHLNQSLEEEFREEEELHDDMDDGIDDTMYL
ncbi:unnamed protein product [Calypogeia fissa]